MKTHKKYHHQYSEVFEQFRIHLGDDKDFYYWFTPLCRIDVLGAADRTLAVPAMHKSEQGNATVCELEFKSSVWPEKKAYVIFREGHVEYYVEVKGKGVIDRIYFFTGLLGGQPFGSVPGFDAVVPGCTNFLTKKELFGNEFFSISAANDTTHWGHSLCGGPFIYMFSRHGRAARIWAGLVVGKGGNIFDSFDFNHRPPELENINDSILNTQSFSVNYSGHMKVEGTWRSPSVVLGFSRSKTAALEDYCRLLEQRKCVPKAGVSRNAHPWHMKPIFCGWHEQVALGRLKEKAGGMAKEQLEGAKHIMDECTQANHERWIDILSRERIPFGTLIIDAKWQRYFARFEADERKWPDMRGFIDSCHGRGIKVLLWIKAWSKEGLEPELCIRKDGVPVSMDPSNPAYGKILEDGVAHMLGAGPCDLNADGLKIDGTVNIPCGRGVVSHGKAYGFELQHLLTELIWKKAVAVKPDSLVSLYIANPYFRDTCNMVRLGDLYTIYGRPSDSLNDRADVVRIAMRGIPIDTDGVLRFSLSDDFREELELQASLGIPCIYQVENLYRHRTFVKEAHRRLGPKDYAAIRKVFTRHIRNLGVEGMWQSHEKIKKGELV